MKKLYVCLLLKLVFSYVSVAQNVNYSPAYFGPNANPVHQFGDARIPSETTVRLSGSHFFGFGDNTTNPKVSVEIPLLPEFVSFKVWVVPIEHYRVSQEVFDQRNMTDGLSGTAQGDFYVQTRILLLRETRFRPSIILGSALKTASGRKFEQRRFFDTPGYFFDLEIGKSFHFESRFLSELRAVGNLGFLCWETTNSTQNDAVMFGGKIILSNRLFDFENTLAGYHGWMGNGDSPLVFSSKFRFKRERIDFFVQYQYGIRDFPFHHIQAGVAFRLATLTPRFGQS